MHATQIILAPIVSEKSVLGQGAGQHSFRVHRDADKQQVARAVADLFSVKVAAVRTSRLPGKEGRRLRGGKTMTRRRETKKAVVQLAAGQVLDVGKLWAKHAPKKKS